jgi:anti-sigma factor ChrR (cupin superfamily)
MISPAEGRRRLVHTDEMAWEASPSPGVLRKRLEQWGPPEAGRVTSLVRYEAGSRFASHPHPDGEEILVLDGVFGDEHGEYPPGTFLLNPEGFEHAPFSRDGCTLFVKLRQSPGPREPTRIDTHRAEWQPTSLAGVSRLTLHQSERFPECIYLSKLEPGVAPGRVALPDGEEIFVLAGSFRDEHAQYRAGSWALFPPGASHCPSSPGGCTLYVKQGHLSVASGDR